MEERSAWQARIGVGERSWFFRSYGDAPRTRDVVVEEGPLRGTVGGFHTDHADGRVDATVRAGVFTPNPNIVVQKEQA
jgi:hypothetical protein